MRRADHRKALWLMGVCVAELFVVILGTSARAASDDRTDVFVEVKDAETGKPLPQAHLTFSFREPGSKAKLKRSKWLSYSAKTNPQGRYKFTNIPKGPVHVVATADRHQTFGKDFELERDNQVIEITLKKPQPLL